jgi:hypothetical protein
VGRERGEELMGGGGGVVRGSERNKRGRGSEQGMGNRMGEKGGKGGREEACCTASPLITLLEQQEKRTQQQRSLQHPPSLPI